MTKKIGKLILLLIVLGAIGWGIYDLMHAPKAGGASSAITN